MKRMISAVITIGVIALIRTDASPALWQVSLVALMFYGINCLIIDAVTDEIRRSRRRKSRELELKSIRRWAEEDFGGRYIEIIS